MQFYSRNTQLLSVKLNTIGLHCTKNLLVDETGERYRLNHAVVVKLFHPYTQFPRNLTYLLGKSLPFWRFVTFLIIALINLTCLLTFLVDNIYGSSISNTYKLNF